MKPYLDQFVVGMTIDIDDTPQTYKLESEKGTKSDD